MSIELENETNDEHIPNDRISMSSSNALMTKSLSTETISSSFSTTLSSNKWLLANNELNANLYTIPTAICLADLLTDGDYKLIIADLGFDANKPKLKVYKGTTLQTESTLVDIPCGIVVFHMDGTEPLTPAIAVASGAYLYVYKNMKPFYKFSLPALEVSAQELEVWTKCQTTDVTALKEMLANVRMEIGDTCMSARTQAFLELEDTTEMEKFVDLYKDQPLKRLTVITCITTINKTVADENAVCCLVLGTENRDVYILEPDAFTILVSATLPSVPVFIDVNGLFDVEYRILVSCRDAHIYAIKRGYKTGRLCAQLNSQPVGLLRINNNIVIATMDQMLSAFSTKGNCLWSVKQPAIITTIEAIDVERQGIRLIAVALDNRQIHLFQDRNRVDIIETEDTVVSMKFGRFGREDNTLVMVSRSGGLTIKIMKRTAKFTAKEFGEPPTPSNTSKLNIPKKTKLFVDQTMREREQSVSIHRTFQHDLYRLKLTAARTYVKAISSSLNPISSNALDPLKLSAQVHGLGPVFRLILEIENTSPDTPSMDLFLTFQCDVRIYTIGRSVIRVPFLTPGFVYTFATRVECISKMNISDIIKVFVVREGENIPIITAVINMPSSEAPIE